MKSISYNFTCLEIEIHTAYAIYFLDVQEYTTSIKEVNTFLFIKLYLLYNCIKLLEIIKA